MGGSQDITLNPVSTEFRSISQKGYIGSSVVYDPENSGSRHLYAGTTLAI
jgi:hypothetical protein